MMHKEIAAELGVTTRTIERIEKTALTKCRYWAMARGIRAEDLLAEVASIDPEYPEITEPEEID